MEFDYFEEKIYSGELEPRYIIGFVSKRSIISERLASSRRSVDTYNHLKDQGTLDRRAALMNWMRGTICCQYLSDASINNAIELVDKYLLDYDADDDKAIAVGAAALLISSKWHDDNNLQINDIPNLYKKLKVTDAVSREYRERFISQVRKNEVKMIDYFDWIIEEITPYAYLANCNLRPEIRAFALHLARLFAITDMQLVNTPLEIAVICVFLAHKLYNITPVAVELAEVEMLIDVSATELEDTFDILSVYSRKYKTIDSETWEELMRKYVSFK